MRTVESTSISSRSARDESADIVATNLTLPATDSHRLAATRFEHREAKPSAPLVIISSATGVPRGFYTRFATSLAARGLVALTYDYRGIGGSRPRSLRGFRARMSEWGTHDFEGVLRYAQDELGRARVRVVGHSVGGQMLGFAESNACVERVVGVGAQLGDYRLWPRAEQPKMLALWYGVVPIANAVFGYLPGKLGTGEDLPKGIAREWRDWCVTPGYFFGDGHEARVEGFARIDARMLAISTESDPYAPRAAVDAWAASFPRARVVREHIGDARLGHFGFFRAGSSKHWSRIADFLA